MNYIISLNIFYVKLYKKIKYTNFSCVFNFFDFIQKHLINFADFINCPYWLSDLLILGIYRTLTWVISVMLPPMAIFFPLFTFLEDLGYLPRLAFNVDGLFKKCCCSGKQMITMCLGVTKWKIF